MKLNICMVAHFAYGAISGGKQGHVGGVERQTSLMAKWFAGQGHTVSLLTWDEGGSSEEHIDGVRVIKICQRESGIPGVRFFSPRWTGLVRAMKAADADVYYQNCGEYVTGQVAMFCKRHNRKFVYSLASDADADASLAEMRTTYEKVFYRYGLRHSDWILTQTRKQAQLLKSGFGLDSQIMPMPCPGPTESEFEKPSWPSVSKPKVLWAGRLTRSKRLEMLVDVASELKDIEFLVAGKPDEQQAYIDSLLLRMDAEENVTYLGAVERGEMPVLYAESVAFCCTSRYEGFPNTFLEAWSYGLPTISTFDPDNLISDKKLGFSVETVAEMVRSLSRLQNDQTSWREMSANARKHYANNYTEDTVMKRMEQVFQSVENRLST